MSGRNGIWSPCQAPRPTARAGALVAVLWAFLHTGAMAQGDFQGSTHLMPFDEDTIAYSKATADGPVARLQKKIDSGEVKFQFDDQFGYLRSLLSESSLNATGTRES